MTRGGYQQDLTIGNVWMIFKRVLTIAFYITEVMARNRDMVAVGKTVTNNMIKISDLAFGFIKYFYT